MNEWRKVILVPKEEGILEPSHASGPPLSVLLLQNDASTLREDLIVESMESNNSPPVSSKRMIHLENRMEQGSPISRCRKEDKAGKSQVCSFLPKNRTGPLSEYKSPFYEEEICSKRAAMLSEEIVRVRNALTTVDVSEFPSEGNEDCLELLDPLQDTSPHERANVYLRPHKILYPVLRHKEAAQPIRLPHKSILKEKHEAPRKRGHKSKGHRIVQCEKCDKSFKSFDNLRNHIIRSHLTCSVCAKTCKTFIELDLHHEETHNCSICKKSFISRENIDKHKKLVHNICNICYMVFNSSAELQGHTMEHHPNCSVCGLIFRDQESRSKHERVHFQCTNCIIIFKSRKEKQRHLSLHHTCAVCNKLFGTIAGLATHMIAHRTCSICKMLFKTVTEQVNHQRDYHIKCNICSIIFRRKEDYTQHLRQAHQLITPRRITDNPEKDVIFL